VCKGEALGDKKQNWIQTAVNKQIEGKRERKEYFLRHQHLARHRLRAMGFPRKYFNLDKPSGIHS
jgi:hypothetical protein